MTVPTHSTVPTVKAALKTVIAAQLAGVQVFRVHPGDAQLTEGVRIGDARGRHQVAVMAQGRTRRDEEYTVDVFVEAVAPGDDGQPAEERAFAILAGVEDAIAADSTLGNALPLAGPSWGATPGAFDARTYMDSDVGWGCTIRFEVNVRARLG